MEASIAQSKESFRNLPEEESRINEDSLEKRVSASKVSSPSKAEAKNEQIHSTSKISDAKKEETSMSFKPVPQEVSKSSLPEPKHEIKSNVPDESKQSVKESSVKDKPRPSEIEKSLPESLPKESVASVSVNAPKK